MKKDPLLEKEGQIVDETVLSQMKNPWLLYFLKFNPETYFIKSYTQ
jgi:hypothetical protein